MDVVWQSGKKEDDRVAVFRLWFAELDCLTLLFDVIQLYWDRFLHKDPHWILLPANQKVKKMLQYLLQVISKACAGA